MNVDLHRIQFGFAVSRQGFHYRRACNLHADVRTESTVGVGDKQGIFVVPVMENSLTAFNSHRTEASDCSGEGRSHDMKSVFNTSDDLHFRFFL